jgi:hypothetical protein
MTTMELVSATAVTLAVLALPVAVKAADPFRKLTGVQIGAKVAGMEITDEVHWRDVFERNGTLMSHSMGRKTVGQWRVQKDELCLDRGKDDGACYQVWVLGTKVELRRERSSLPLEGLLQRPRQDGVR